MILTVFRSRLREESRAAYAELAPRIDHLATTMPGYRSHKSFIAADGERVTIAEFEDEAAQRNWARNAEHRAAMHAGKESFYAEYSIQVCRIDRESRFTAP